MEEVINLTDLAQGRSIVSVVGKVKINENTFSGVTDSKNSDFKYVRVNLGIQTSKTNTIYGEIMGGYSPSNPVIKAQGKGENATKMEINWSDRKNEKILASVADFNLLKGGLVKKEDGTVETTSFLNAIDFHDYLKENLVNDMEVIVSGSFEFSEYNGDAQRKFNIQRIAIPYQKKGEDGELLPVEYRANFAQTILLDEDSFKKISKADKDAGAFTVSAYGVSYVSKKDGKPFQKNVAFELPIKVKINEDNFEKMSKIADKLFKIKKGTVRELIIEGTIVEGYDEQEISDKDIEMSDEIKELIELGFYSEEEAKQKLTVRGNKVKDLVFTRPFIQKDKDNGNQIIMPIDDKKYTPADLIVDVIEEDKNPLDESADAPSNDDGGTDDSWMDALGVS